MNSTFYMNYIVLDLEWNQRVTQNLVRTKPVYLSGEIIQFGAVKLDEKYHICSEFRQLVKPNFYKKLHWSVAKLTKIKAEDLSAFGLPFQQAVRRFFDWCGPDPVFITWGPDDIPMLRSNLLMYGMSTDLLAKSYDLQPIFDSQISHLDRQLALSDAMIMVNEEELTAHDALNDAINTAALCKHLDMDRGIAEYKRVVNLDNLPILDNVDFKFADMSAMRASDRLKNFACPACGGKTACSTWIDSGKGRKLSLADCQNGHQYLVRLKIKKSPDESLSVIRSVFDIDDEIMAFYKDKEEKYNIRLEKYYARLEKSKHNKKSKEE